MSSEINKSVKYSKFRNYDVFPRVIIFILVAEFCERMSYSGMRVFLTLYLRNKLDYTDDEATEIYHIFNCLVYLCPVFGGIIADNYVGKYRTILYMMFVYATGNLLVALTAIPQLMMPGRLCTLLGLFMITMGTGGIKPCVTAFGGEQFVMPEQEKHLSLYFSVLYFNLCIGSLIAKTLSPIFRAEVHCFGDKDCYSLAFVVFISGRRRYVIKEPEGNIVVDFTKCIFLGLKNKVKKVNRNENHHWLDSTRSKYVRKFINDIKKTLSVLQLFAVLPVFWALLDQMGSRWALQASRMDGRLGFYTIKPDQMLILSPITVLSFIPLSQKYIYPFLAKWNLLTNPLNKLKLGGIMAGLAFVASGGVEVYLKNTYPELPRSGFSQLRVFNGNPCDVLVNIRKNNVTCTIPPQSYFFNKRIAVVNTENMSLNLEGNCFDTRNEVITLEETNANSFFLTNDKIYSYTDNVEKSKSGLPLFLFANEADSPNIELYNNELKNVEVNISLTGVSERFEVFSSIYSLRLGDQKILKDLRLENGGVYTILIGKILDSYEANLIVITEPNSISMLLLIPQFVLVSIAEVLFAVTGNEFAFKEAPQSMKAAITAIWLLTEAFGNILIIIFTRFWIKIDKEVQFFMYAAMMFLSMTVFHYLCRNYRFNETEVVDETLAIKDYDNEHELHEIEKNFTSNDKEYKSKNKT